jgi:hypothetical protein
MKKVSLILIVAGIIGLIYFGIQAINNSESFSFLGLDVAVSRANWTPVIISAGVLVSGIVVNAIRRK